MVHHGIIHKETKNRAVKEAKLLQHIWTLEVASVNEWTNEWMSERTNERTNERTDGRTDGRTNEWMNEWMNEWNSI